MVHCKAIWARQHWNWWGVGRYAGKMIDCEEVSALRLQVMWWACGHEFPMSTIVDQAMSPSALGGPSPMLSNQAGNNTSSLTSKPWKQGSRNAGRSKHLHVRRLWKTVQIFKHLDLPMLQEAAVNNKHQPPPCFLFFSLPKTNPFVKTKSSSEKFFLTRLICFFDWLTCCISCPIPTTPRLIPTSITPFHLGNSRVLIIIPIRFQKPPRLKRQETFSCDPRHFLLRLQNARNWQSNVTNYRACHKNNNSNVTKYYYCFCTSETFLLNAIPNPFRILFRILFRISFHAGKRMILRNHSLWRKRNLFSYKTKELVKCCKVSRFEVSE